MKDGFRRICLLSRLIMLLSFTSIYSADNEWDIKIELSKQDFVFHEPVPLDVTLINNTLDTLRRHGLIIPNQYHFYILLTDSRGREMKYTGPQDMVVWGPGELLLDAGGQDYDNFNLLELFGLIEFNSGYKVDPWWFPFMPKGTYSVKVSYEGDLSNELTFNIIEPYGQEDKVLRKIEQAGQTWSRADTDPSSQIYGEIVRDYPNSAFAEKCFYLHRVFANNMEGSISLGTKGRIFHRELLSKYPNSGYVKGWLDAATLGWSKDERIALYNGLIDEHPDTKCSRVASLLKKRLLAKREAGE